MALKAKALALKLVLLCGIISSFVIYYSPNRLTVTEDHSPSTSYNSSRLTVTDDNFPKKNQFKDNYRPKILIWAKQYRVINWKMLDLPNGELACDITWDRTNISRSDAVVFFMKSCSSKDLPPPSLRSQNQAYVWWSGESPWMVRNYYHHELKDFGNYFNWTMTYRTNSDVLSLFLPVPAMDYVFHRMNRTKDISKQNRLAVNSVMSDTQFKSELDRLMSRKKKLISWIVSDCDLTSGASKRRTLTENLKKEGLLQIDEFGKCIGKSIPLNYTILFETLAPYKFYFAFENAIHCKDYVTEKVFYNCLIAGVVPIIFGPLRRDVKKLLPPRSFIHTDDFPNYTDLRMYLNYLNSNDTAYKEYFNWWKTPGAQLYPRYGFNYGSDSTKGIVFTKDGTRLWNYAVQDSDNDFARFGFYHLCRKLRNMDHLKTKKTISNLHAVWYGVERDDCMNN